MAFHWPYGSDCGLVVCGVVCRRTRALRMTRRALSPETWRQRYQAAATIAANDGRLSDVAEAWGTTRVYVSEVLRERRPGIHAAILNAPHQRSLPEWEANRRFFLYAAFCQTRGQGRPWQGSQFVSRTALNQWMTQNGRHWFLTEWLEIAGLTRRRIKAAARLALYKQRKAGLN